MAEPLADFLLSRVAEDEAVAHSAMGRGVHDERPEVREWLGLANPARMLTWSEGRRRIIKLHSAANGSKAVCSHCGHPLPCPTLRLLAVVYSDHPDYQEQWRI